MLWSIISVTVASLDIAGAKRIILGSPFTLFIPGYVLIFALFPIRKTNRGIYILERFALSFGFSMAVAALIGFGFNYTSIGIQLESVLNSIFVFVICVGAIAFYRWFKTTPDERFTISHDLSLSKSENKPDRILAVVLVISMILAAATFVYVIVTPERGEQFTEFYILASSGKAGGYFRDLSVGENASVIIGIKNHEYQTISYTVEIWLINQTNIYNEITKESETIYHHTWFMDKINIILDHISTDTERSWEPQWEYNYTFNISKKGEGLKLTFLLFTTPTEDYSYDKDYKGIIEQKISSAYGETHLWINVI